MEVTRPLLACLIFVYFSTADKYHNFPESENDMTLNSYNKIKLMATQPVNSKKIHQKVKQFPPRVNTKTAKNIIFFIGDGLSIGTATATRFYLGSPEVQLASDKFPYFGLSKTYCVDRQVCDSASTATALLSGIKTNYGLIGLNANVNKSQCTFTANDVTGSILKWAQDSKKATGIVSTARVSDATLAAAYAQVSDRNWEYDKSLPKECRNKVADITDQLVSSDIGRKLNVILGGGKQNFIPKMTIDEEGRKGLREDGRNLIAEWLWKKYRLGTAKYVWNKSQLDAIKPQYTDYLLGLFEADNCMYHLDVLAQNKQSTEPSLEDMTKSAINILQKNKKGFFLLVEGGRIDHAHHDNYVKKALDETVEFSKAIEMAKNMTSEDNTLIVVTGDHSNVMTIAGYSRVSTNILEDPKHEKGTDGYPFETLSYANGPGYYRTYGPNGRNDISNDDFEDTSRQYSATVPLKSSTHGGEDVGVYASGPWSHLFTGSFEQNEIPIAMAYSAKIGPYAE